MYYYWVKRGIRPSVFYSMSRGELTVIQAFYAKELEEREELSKKLQNNH
jgi:hypothetical protein